MRERRDARSGTRDRRHGGPARGGLDGLSLAAPVGDPDYVRLRELIALPKPGETGGGLPLNSMFALNPNMPFLHTLYRKNEALVVKVIRSA